MDLVLVILLVCGGITLNVGVGCHLLIKYNIEAPESFFKALWMVSVWPYYLRKHFKESASNE